MDYLFSLLTAEGIPAGILHMALKATGLYGGARYTKALAALGPGGIIGGLVTLGIVQIASFVITESVIERIYICVIHQMYKDGTSLTEILSNVNSYNISDNLKEKLRNEAMSYASQKEETI